MKAYVKPDMEITTFVPNEAIAANGCTHVDASNPTAITVYCVIGGQSETIFLDGMSGCTSKAKYKAIIDNESGDDYFIWYTYAGDGAEEPPADEVKNKLDNLVKQAGYDPGSGWHYTTINANGTSAYDTLKVS